MSGLAALHVAIILIGARAYAYFGASNLASMAQRGSSYPAFLTAFITILLLVWSAYAFSGAGILPRLPLLRTVLVAITIVFALRGLVLIPDAHRLIRGAPYPARQASFSGFALMVGILYGVGALRAFHDIATRRAAV